VGCPLPSRASARRSRPPCGQRTVAHHSFGRCPVLSFQTQARPSHTDTAAATGAQMSAVGT
jgi:hypothetical protein